jgi:hypothetical protein
MSTLTHRILFITVGLLLAAAPLIAEARPGGAHVGVGVGHHHHHHGHVRWGVGVGIGFGLWPYAYPYAAPYGYPYYGWAPGTVVVEQPVVVERPVPAAPMPTFTPQRGQSLAQFESDRRQCDREAMSDPGAMADAGVFHRRALACMASRGYTVR